MYSPQTRKKWRVFFSLALASGLLSACLQPLTATPPPTQEVVQIALPAELTPLRPAIQVCSQEQPGLALFEENKDISVDIRFSLGEPTGLDETAVEVAREQIRVIVNTQNPVEALTQTDFMDLYTGRKTDWKELDGESEPAVAWTYPAGDAIRNIIDRYLLAGQRPSGGSFLAPSPEAMREAVAQDRGAIGYLPAAWLDNSVKAIELEPTLGQALTQPVLAITRENQQGMVLRLLACLQSGTGHAEILQTYPLSAPQE